MIYTRTTCKNCGENLIVKRDKTEMIRCNKCGANFFLDDFDYESTISNKPTGIGDSSASSSNIPNSNNSQYDSTAMLVVTAFFGIFGLHKFLEGKYVWGIIYLLTNGLFLVGWIFDTIVAVKRYNDARK